MRIVHMSDLGQPGVNIPRPPPLLVPSKVGVNVYQGGYPSGEGYWGGDALPVEGAEIVVTVVSLSAAEGKLLSRYEGNIVGIGDESIVVKATTPKGGYVEIPLPVPPGTTVDVAATYQGETQHRKTLTAVSSGDALVEFHFDVSKGPKIPALAIAIPAIIVVALVGYWLYRGR
jgi:hypothetical protein